MKEYACGRSFLVLLCSLVSFSAYAAFGPGIIFGVVYGPDGKPLSGAIVKAYDDDSRQSGGRYRGTFMGEATTGENGNYRIEYTNKGWDGPRNSAIHTWRPDIYVAVHVKETIDGVEYLSKRYVQKGNKRDWKMTKPLEINVALPRGKCGAGEVLECSNPWSINYSIVPFAKQIFEGACIRHDYCYRHGFLTYGKSRKDCDDEFLAKMRQTCGSYDALKVIVEIATVGARRAACEYEAWAMYQGVRNYGGRSFRKQNGSTCFYDGRPGPPVTRGPTDDPDVPSRRDSPRIQNK